MSEFQYVSERVWSFVMAFYNLVGIRGSKICFQNLNFVICVLTHMQFYTQNDSSYFIMANTVFNKSPYIQ